MIASYYALRAKRLAGDPDYYSAHAGDYSAFDVDKRNQIAATTVGAAFFLEMTSESVASDEEWRREHDSFFDFNSILNAP